MKIGKTTTVVVVALVSLALGIVIAWAVGLAGSGRVRVIDGYAWVSAEGTAIALSPDGETPGEGYVVAGAMWRAAGGSWHDSFPTCLEPLGMDQRVRLGVLHARPKGDAPGRPVVVWIECLH